MKTLTQLKAEATIEQPFMPKVLPDPADWPKDGYTIPTYNETSIVDQDACDRLGKVVTPQTASDSLSPVKERLIELQNKFIDQLNKIRGDCDIIEARIKTRVIKVNDEFAHLGLMFNDTVQKSREMTDALAEIQKTIGD